MLTVISSAMFPQPEAIFVCLIVRSCVHVSDNVILRFSAHASYQRARKKRFTS